MFKTWNSLSKKKPETLILNWENNESRSSFSSVIVYSMYVSHNGSFYKKGVSIC